MSNEHIIRKIKACLARARSTDSENEAAIALRQAQALMKEYGISQADVVLSEVKDAFANGSRVKDLAQWESLLVDLVCDTFGTVPVLHPRAETDFSVRGWKTEYRTDVQFIGFGWGPELSAYAYNVLLRQLKKDRSEYLKSLDKRLKRQTKTRRADLFAQEWVFAAREAVIAIRPTSEQYALIERYKTATLGELEKADARRHGKFDPRDFGAAAAGAAAGKKARLNRGVDGSAPVKKLAG